MIGYTLAAARDVVRHQTRLAQLSIRAAKAFADGMALAEVRIQARGDTYRRLKDGETRRYSFKINRTTYLIDYRVGLAEIVVLRVWHGRQNRPQ